MTPPGIPQFTTLGNALLILFAIMGAYFVLALLLSLLSRRIARLLLGLRWLVPGHRKMTGERRQTLEGLIGSVISLLAFVVAGLATLSLFVQTETLVWIAGLFSAAFGLGARGMVADILAGGRFIFRNTFAIGEKVELTVGTTTVEGIVESVNVTNANVRSPSGELFVVPNGDIGVIRNFSRAPYSAIKIRFHVRTDNLRRAVDVMAELGASAASELPDLAEPWQIISTSDVLGNKAEITVVAHAAYAKAAALRLQAFNLIYERLAAAGVELVD